MNEDQRDEGSAAAAPRLLSSNRVEGVVVYDREGDKLGSVAALIFDRFTGQAKYIVVTIGECLESARTIIRYPGDWQPSTQAATATRSLLRRLH